MKRDKRAGAEAGVEPTGFSTGAMPAYSDGRGAPDGIRSVTNRSRASRNGAVVFAVVVFVLAFGIVLAAAQAAFAEIGLVALVSAAIVGWLASSSVHIVLEWEKAVVLRFGKFNRVAGPGLVFTWPIIEFYTLRIDQRVATTYFGAEETLTSDLVPISVDAVLFWMVFSAKKACVEVEDYSAAVAWVAQTAMRKAIGRATVAEVAMRRDQLDAELKDAIEEKLSPWGIDIIDVEVRDIVVPKELQEAMAMGVARRKKNARMVAGRGREGHLEMLKDASEVYAGDQDAMKLRTVIWPAESRAVGRHAGHPQRLQRGSRLKPGVRRPREGPQRGSSAGFERRLLSAQRSSLVEGLQASGLFGSGQHEAKVRTRRFWLLYELGCGRMPQSALIL